MSVKENDSGSKEELRRIIEQIRSITFVPREKEVEDTTVIEPTDPAETIEAKEIVAESNSVQDVNSELQETNRQPSSHEGIMTDETLQIIREVCEDPCQARLENPFELAEIMFRCGHLREASILYRQSLASKTTEQTQTPGQRAWVLFQIGNCLRDDDRPAARKMYRQLIAEYPDSPWTDLARAQEKLLDWYQKEQPEVLTRPPDLQ